MAVVSVVTGDIVNSTKISRAELKKMIKHLEAAFDGHQYEFFRGDSFQVLIKSPAEGLLTLLQARTLVMKQSPASTIPVNDIRASIAIGTAKLPVRSLQTASGEAFVLSGRAFDNMEKARRLIITCDEQNREIHTGLRVIAYFTDYLFQRLTVKQSAVVYELLLNKTQTDIAKKARKTQATVHKHMQAAGWSEIAMLLADYKKMVDLIKA